MIVIDSIDFTWAQSSPNRSEPEDLIHDFITLTGIKVGHVRADGAGEFARSSTFKAYCTRHNIVIEEVPAYTHTFNARVQGAIRICKDKVRAFLRRANMPHRFWPDALLHWCRTYAHWPDASGHTAWEKVDELGPHSLCHDLKRDRHVFGSYVTGHLPREHPHVANTTHDDRPEEGVFLGNDLTTPTFWLWSFNHKKAMRMSDPKHFDHILPFLQPADVHHAIPLTAQEVLRMHAKDDVPVAAGASELQPDRISRSGEQSLPAAAPSPLKPSRVTRSATTASQAAPPLSFPDSGGYWEKNLYRKRRYICHRRNTNASSMAERYHLQHTFNTLNHSSSHRRSYITNLFSPCPRGSGTTPKTSRSWSRKRTASRVFGTLNAT
jgi:hypothetical protein